MEVHTSVPYMHTNSIFSWTYAPHTNAVASKEHLYKCLGEDGTINKPVSSRQAEFSMTQNYGTLTIWFENSKVGLAIEVTTLHI